jgi:hypothetical protein
MQEGHHALLGNNSNNSNLAYSMIRNLSYYYGAVFIIVLIILFRTITIILYLCIIANIYYYLTYCLLFSIIGYP